MMTDPIVAPMTTDVTPVTPDQAPLTDAPTPVATAPVATPAADAVRGRVASPRTVLIRQMLEDSNGEITFSVALPELQKAGFDVDHNTFNVTKSAWKRAKHLPLANTAPKATRKANKPVKPARKVVNVELPEVTVADAIAFVTEQGGLAKAEANVLRGRACLKAFKLLVKQTSKLAA